MNYTAEELRDGVHRIYSDIDICITELINARLQHDEFAEGKALFTMEHLMVATQQMLTCVNDYLFEQSNKENKK